jgi:hypothetical protein
VDRTSQHLAPPHEVVTCNHSEATYCANHLRIPAWSRLGRSQCTQPSLGVMAPKLSDIEVTDDFDDVDLMDDLQRGSDSTHERNSTNSLLAWCSSLLAPQPAAQGFVPLQNVEDESPVGHSRGMNLRMRLHALLAAGVCLVHHSMAQRMGRRGLIEIEGSNFFFFGFISWKKRAKAHAPSQLCKSSSPAARPSSEPHHTRG